MATCIVVAVLSLSIYSCGDDDEEKKGSVNELIGIWEGVTEDEWVVEEGEREENCGKSITNMRYELMADISDSAMTWEFYWKEPGLEMYSKQTLRKITN